MLGQINFFISSTYIVFVFIDRKISTPIPVTMGVITLNQPFETLVPSSMYQASGLQVLYLFILKVICNFTYPMVLRSFINLIICHLGTELLQPKLINQKYVDVNAALLKLTVTWD